MGLGRWKPQVERKVEIDFYKSSLNNTEKTCRPESEEF